MEYKIRPANVAFTPYLRRIYNQGIEDNMAIETRQLTNQEMWKVIAQCERRYRMLVAFNGNEQIMGWACLRRFGLHACYDDVAEVSLYILREACVCEVGAVLLTAVAQAAKGHGFHKLVSTVLVKNEAATALYHELDFREVGVYREQAQIDGKWLDTLLMEKIL